MGEPSFSAMADQASELPPNEQRIADAVVAALLLAKELPSRPLSDALDRYEREHLPHLAPNTQIWRRRSIERLRERYESRTLNKCWSTEAHELYADVRLTPSGAAQCCNTLARICNLARLWGWVDQDHGIGKLAWIKSESETVPYTIEEARRILIALHDLERMRRQPTRATCGLRFLALTGWRPSEVSALEWESLRYGGRVALLKKTKTGPQARVLSEAAIRVIQRRPPMRGNPFVFWGAGDRGVTKATMARILGRAARMARVTAPTLRRFRYTAATQMIKACPDLHSEKLLGHKDIRTTRGYQFAMLDDLAVSADHVATLIMGDEEQ